MEQDKPSPEELERRQQWFERYIDTLENNSVIRGPEDGVTVACPCCGYLTLPRRGDYDICKVCFWEDDGQDDHDADIIRGGPNGSLSLTQARLNFKQFGACEPRFVDKVRPPLSKEMPES
jgi:hypothetical protein